MGTAFAVCFGYWIGSSSFVWVLSYVCNCRIQLIQIMSMLVHLSSLNINFMMTKFLNKNSFPIGLRSLWSLSSFGIWNNLAFFS